MAKLSDLVRLRDNHFITIQGEKVPAAFTFASIDAIESAYGQGYKTFEKDLNIMLKRKVIHRDQKTMKLIWALVYGLLVGGGTETTFDEMNRAIPFSEIPSVIQEAMDILNEQNFQLSDIKK
jgi:hypothetical protein